MAQGSGQAREDQFLGALLGMAIGDALGRSLDGLDATKTAARLSTSLSYGSPEQTGPEGAGAITFRTEVMLCLVESLTTNDGRPDPDNMVARISFLTAGPSAEHMSPQMIEGVALAADGDGQVPESFQPPAALSVATRGVPIGLLHAVGGYDPATLEREAIVVTRLSQAGAKQEQLTAAVARLVAEVGRTRQVPGTLGVPPGVECNILQQTVTALASSDSFEQGLAAALQIDADRPSIGSLAGAVLGTKFGAAGIPQPLIDDLDARIYLSLAAPWFFRTAVMRAGTVIDLRQVT